MSTYLADGLKLGGGLLMLISGFLSWGEEHEGGMAAFSANAFDLFWRGTVPWMLVVGVGAVTFLLITRTIRGDGAPWSIIMTFAAAIAALLILAFLVDPTYRGTTIERGIGCYLGFVAAVTAFAGSVMSVREPSVGREQALDDDLAYEAPAPRRRSGPPLP